MLISLTFMPMQVNRNEQEGKFEIEKDGQRATLDYSMQGPDLALDHTFVPDALRGQGLAQQLSEAALNYARENNWKVLPYCTFVQQYIARHQEYQHLVAPSFRSVE